MSTASFAEGPGNAVLNVWEQEQQVYVARLDENLKLSEPQPMPGTWKNRKHPVVASSKDGQYIVAWTEGTGWNRGGIVEWQLYDSSGKPLPGGSGRAEGLPAWGVPAVVAGPDGKFVVIY